MAVFNNTLKKNYSELLELAIILTIYLQFLPITIKQLQATLVVQNC